MIPSVALDTIAKFLEKPNCPINLKAATRIAMQRARFHPLLLKLPGKLLLSQTFKEDANALISHNFEVRDSLNEPCDVLVYVPTRQKRESQGLMAQGLTQLEAGGLFLGCAENALGGKSYRAYLGELAEQQIESEPFNKCTIFWTARPQTLKSELVPQWLKYVEPSIVEGTSFVSQAGTFGWNSVDQGSELLKEYFDDRIQGRVADFGSGYGYLSYHLLEKSQKIEELWLYEAEKISLECSKINLKKFSNSRVEYRWQDLVLEVPKIKADWVITNPPCHDSGKQSLDQGLKFIQSAYESLKQGGRLLLVANLTLPYEKALSELFSEVDGLGRAKGFKVLEARK